MSAASHRLEQSSRAYNYGFDVSKLYEREEAGRKDWRAEVAPSDDEKRCAKAAVVTFKEEFPLGGVTLDGIFASHRAHVSQLLEHDSQLWALRNRRIKKWCRKILRLGAKKRCLGPGSHQGTPKKRPLHTLRTHISLRKRNGRCGGLEQQP